MPLSADLQGLDVAYQTSIPLQLLSAGALPPSSSLVPISHVRSFVNLEDRATHVSVQVSWQPSPVLGVLGERITVLPELNIGVRCHFLTRSLYDAVDSALPRLAPGCGPPDLQLWFGSLVRLPP